MPAALSARRRYQPGGSRPSPRYGGGAGDSGGARPRARAGSGRGRSKQRSGRPHLPGQRARPAPYPPLKFLITSFLEEAVAPPPPPPAARVAASEAGLVSPFVCPTKADKCGFFCGSSAISAPGAVSGRGNALGWAGPGPAGPRLRSPPPPPPPPPPSRPPPLPAGGCQVPLGREAPIAARPPASARPGGDLRCGSGFESAPGSGRPAALGQRQPRSQDGSRAGAASRGRQQPLGVPHLPWLFAGTRRRAARAEAKEQPRFPPTKATSPRGRPRPAHRHPPNPTEPSLHEHGTCPCLTHLPGVSAFRSQSVREFNARFNFFDPSSPTPLSSAPRGQNR